MKYVVSRHKNIPEDTLLYVYRIEDDGTQVRVNKEGMTKTEANEMCDRMNRS